MKNLPFLALLCGMIILSACNNSNDKVETHDKPNAVSYHAPVTPDSQFTGEPWNEEQLLDPADLAYRIQSSQELPVIISLGAGNIIPGSKDTGATGEKAGFKNLEKELENHSKDTEIVLYCGCCPFNICPNIRPAFDLLNKEGFTNHHLLNLPENIKVDWIDKGYATGN